MSLSDTGSLSDADSDSLMGSGADANGTTDAVTLSEVQGSAGFVIAIAIVAMLLMILLIVVRICNIGLINLKINVFLIIVSWNYTVAGFCPLPVVIVTDQPALKLCTAHNIIYGA